MKRIVLIVLGILVFSCTTEDFEKELIDFEEPNSNLSSSIIEASYSYNMDKNSTYIQKNAPSLFTKYASKGADVTSVHLNWGEILTDEVLVVDEVNGFTSRSYKIEAIDYKDDEIYNLVFLEKGENVTAHVYGYKMDDSFKVNYHQNGELLGNFSGQIYSIQLDLADNNNELDCIDFLNDLFNGHQNSSGSTSGGSNNGGIAGQTPGGSASSGGWFTGTIGGSPSSGGDGGSTPEFSNSTEPWDWTWISDVGGAVTGAVNSIGSWIGNTWNGIKNWIRNGGGCKCGRGLEADGGKVFSYVVVDLDEEHDCYPLAIGIIQSTISEQYIADLFGIAIDDLKNLRDNHEQLFVDMVDIVMEGDFSEDRLNFFVLLTQALNNGNIQVDNIENLLIFLDENNTDDAINFALELLEILEGNPELSFVDSIITLKGQKLNIDIEFSVYLEFENDYKQRMSQSEIAIFESLNLYQQTSYLVNAFIAETKANINYPGLVLNGIGDAYRHALWNALCTFDLGLELTESLTTAHEDQPSTHPYDYKENEMDLFNNDKGRQIAFNYSENLPIFSPPLSIFDLIEQAVSFGYLRYLNNLSSNSRPTEHSELIPTNQ